MTLFSAEKKSAKICGKKKLRNISRRQRCLAQKRISENQRDLWEKEI